ncbi:hypothetical protein ACWDRR_09085 [Kitasatospora sp. NPDC003701]
MALFRRLLVGLVLLLAGRTPAAPSPLSSSPAPVAGPRACRPPSRPACARRRPRKGDRARRTCHIASPPPQRGCSR